MLQMSDVDAMLVQAVSFIGAAVSAYGVGVLTRAEDGAASATVRLGQRLLALILRRARDPEPVKSAVGDLADAGGTPDALAALRLQVRKVLASDESLVAELAALVAPQPTVSMGARSVYLRGSNSGSIATGDHSRIGSRR
jgi:hypothetical protein